MTMVNELRENIKTAMRAKDEIRRDILRVVLGEVETIQATTNQAGKPVTDEQIQKICRKIMVANDETMAVETCEVRKAKLVRENEVLDAMIPKLLTQDQIREKVGAIIADLKGAKSEGQAVGLAMKLLKSTNEAVDGNDVKVVVTAVRAE